MREFLETQYHDMKALVREPGLLALLLVVGALMTAGAMLMILSLVKLFQ